MCLPSLLVVEVAEVQHVGLSELLLHLVDLVRADGVQVQALELLFEVLGRGEVVQVEGRALHEIADQLLVALIHVALVIVVAAVRVVVLGRVNRGRSTPILHVLALVVHLFI